MPKCSNSIAICLVALLTSTCNTIYQHTIKLPRPTWNAQECLVFSFEIQNSTQAYNMYTMIQSRQDYPYQNLYLTYYLEDTTQLHKSDLVNTWLFEPKTGKPTGKAKHTLLENYYFPHAGWYTLRLVPYMRTENLTGVQSVGIQVEQCVPKG